MITIDNVTYRNLQEQVQKNKEDIAAFTGVEFTLNNFGIKVIGVVKTEADIPSGAYEYGDAYLVGKYEPYNMYVYTRNKEGEGTGSFVDLGPLNIVGQQGPQGEKGEKGDDGYGPVVRVGTGLPVVLNTDKSGYLYIDSTTSKLYTFTDKWTYACDMQGMKGDRGEKGLQGATGTTLSIVGKLSSPSLLPTNFTTGAIPKNTAYLVTENNALILYIILGDQDDYSTWYWQSVGDFNLGSMLYKNNNYIQSINVVDTYNTLTGSLVTDTATSQLKTDVDTLLAAKEDKSTHDEEMLKKADVETVNTLSNKVDQIESSLGNEVNRAVLEELSIRSDLSSEITSRTNGDSALRTDLNSEISSRENAIAQITLPNMQTKKTVGASDITLSGFTGTVHNSSNFTYAINGDFIQYSFKLYVTLSTLASSSERVLNIPIPWSSTPVKGNNLQEYPVYMLSSSGTFDASAPTGIRRGYLNIIDSGISIGISQTFTTITSACKAVIIGSGIVKYR